MCCQCYDGGHEECHDMLCVCVIEVYANQYISLSDNNVVIHVYTVKMLVV